MMQASLDSNRLCLQRSNNRKCLIINFMWGYMHILCSVKCNSYIHYHIILHILYPQDNHILTRLNWPNRSLGHEIWLMTNAPVSYAQTTTNGFRREGASEAIHCGLSVRHWGVCHQSYFMSQWPTDWVNLAKLNMWLSWGY